MPAQCYARLRASFTRRYAITLARRAGDGRSGTLPNLAWTFGPADERPGALDAVTRRLGVAVSRQRAFLPTPPLCSPSPPPRKDYSSQRICCAVVFRPSALGSRQISGLAILS